MLSHATSGEVQNFAGIHPTRPADLAEEETEGNTTLWICTHFCLRRS